MDMKNLVLTGAVAFIAASASIFTVFSQDDTRTKLSPGTKILAAGDGVTDMKGYLKYTNVYLACCSGIRDVRFFISTAPNETANEFAKRMERDTAFWKPDLVLLNYGLSDVLRNSSMKNYEQQYLDQLSAVIQYYKKMPSRVFLLSPIALDPLFYRKNVKDLAAKTNTKLKSLSSLTFETAIREKTPYMDLYSLFEEYTAKGREKFGPKYHICGADGCHPTAAGHLVVTWALLKKLGVSGKIADIRMNMNGKGSTVSEGHSIKSEKPGILEISSTRYPYCFGRRTAKKDGEPADVYAVLQILPFQQELNQFMLTVSGLTASKASVTWGKFKKDFTKEQLEAGINLASEFEENPFQEAFTKVAQAVQDKINFNVMLLHSFTKDQTLAGTLKISDKGAEAFQTVLDELRKLHDRYEENILARTVPVIHTITVREIKQ